MSRISYNKAQELANHIEGAELTTYANGNVALVFNAAVPTNIDGTSAPDKPMEKLTKYNKKLVSLEEAKELILEHVPFKVFNTERPSLRGYHFGLDKVYYVESYDVTLASWQEQDGWYFRNMTKSMLPEDTPKNKVATILRHNELVKEVLNVE